MNDISLLMTPETVPLLVVATTKGGVAFEVTTTKFYSREVVVDRTQVGEVHVVVVLALAPTAVA